MAKNRVASDRNPKAKDKFFKKASSKFQNPRLQHKNTKEDNRPTPSTSSSNFFIKSKNSGTCSEPKPSKSQTPQENPQPKTTTEKKPFDKKKYRLQKYSKKYKLQQWEDKRKKTVLRGYYKSLKEDETNHASKIYKDYENEIDDENVNSEVDKNEDKTIVKTDNEEVDTKKEPAPKNSKERRNKSFRKAAQEFQRIKEEKQQKKELFLKKKAEKEEALQEYKKKKIEKHKKLNKKNKKGQPIMKGRIEMLLEQIQNSIKK